MKYKLEVLTPVMVGSNEVLTRLDCVRDGDYLYIVDVDGLVDSLDPEVCEKFSGELFRLDRLDQAIRNVGLDVGNVLRDFSRYRVRCLEDGVVEVKTLVKNARFEAYIPSSSLKGSVRTAIYYYFFGRSPEVRNYVCSLIQRAKSGRDVNRSLLRFFVGRGGKESYYDPLRFIRFGDSKPLKVDSVAEVFRVSLFEAGRGVVFLPTFIEGLIPGATFEGEFYFDVLLSSEAYDAELKGFRNLDILNVQKLPKILNNFARRVIENELNFFARYGMSEVKEFYDKLKGRLEGLTEDEALVRLGWGSGYLSVTVGLLFKEDAKFSCNLRRLLRRVWKPYVKDFPATRKMVRYRGKYHPLGWTKLKFEA